MTKSLTALAAATTIGIASVAAPSTADARWGRMVGAGYRRLCRWRAHRERVRTALLRIWLRLWVLLPLRVSGLLQLWLSGVLQLRVLRTATLLPPLLRTAALLPLVNRVRPLFAFLSVWWAVNPKGGRPGAAPFSTSRERFGAAAASTSR